MIDARLYEISHIFLYTNYYPVNFRDSILGGKLLYFDGWPTQLLYIYIYIYIYYIYILYIYIYIIHVVYMLLDAVHDF